MIWAQVSSGLKLHLALEAGEEMPTGEIVRKGHLSLPICGHRIYGSYRMTCNLPLSHACKRCVRVAKARSAERDKE